MDYGNREIAGRISRSLLVLEMPNHVFRKLHHRDTLRDYEGVKEHLKWLEEGKVALVGRQKILQNRLHACLEAWLVSGSWDAAVRAALEAVPK